MNRQQFQTCYDRVAEIDGNAALRLLRLVKESDALIAEGWSRRAQAWELYRQVTGRKRRADG